MIIDVQSMKEYDLVFLKRLLHYLVTMLFLNTAVLIYAAPLVTPLKVVAAIILFGIYVAYNIKPGPLRSVAFAVFPRKLKTLIGGYELVLMSILCLVSETALYIYLTTSANTESSPFKGAPLILNGVLCAIFLLLMFIGGFVRVFLASSQIKTGLRFGVILLWWVPVVNIILFYLCCKNAQMECKFELEKLTRNAKRKNEKICATKYPILMVHGIFFRDWKFMGYWGRIPDELSNNGATIYYGNQQSSSTVEQNADELKQRILEIIKESGCEKVNIIAHSKGGLDSRYAISCLGMAPYVASLTTINTPHLGCTFAGKLIDIAPESFVSSLGKKYESLFGKLGDKTPDFLGGVSELTVERCTELNEKMLDSSGVLYQSVGSKMHSHSSAAFPLNAVYGIIKPLDGDNDGLVATKSMVWGNFMGLLESPQRLGISHADIIDLTRKNIYGFDVCEYYVELVKGLKDKGL